jgi:hypothetical protein
MEPLNLRRLSHFKGGMIQGWIPLWQNADGASQSAEDDEPFG